jgi:hypothetical protein
MTPTGQICRRTVSWVKPTRPGGGPAVPLDPDRSERVKPAIVDWMGEFLGIDDVSEK